MSQSNTVHPKGAVANIEVDGGSLKTSFLRTEIRHGYILSPLLFFFFKILLTYLERGEGEREGEKHQCVVAPPMSPAGDLAHTPGMCPD